MKTPLLRLVFLAVCLSGLAGCTSHGTLGGIAVTVVGLKPATAPENEAVVTLRYANENVAAVGMANATHKLYLNGIYVGKATSDTPTGLREMAPTMQEIPMKFENPALVRELANSPGAQAVNYRLESDMLVVVIEDHIHVISTEQGTLDLSPLAGMK